MRISHHHHTTLAYCRELAAADDALAPLREPDGRIYFAGDYMTDMSSWMQGAFESGRHVATALHRRALVRG
jgi:monoamine oxidase